MIRIKRLADDILGPSLCFMLGLLNRLKPEGITQSKEEIKQILVIQYWGVGETILTIPAIQGIKKQYPEAKIDIVCTERNADVYRGIFNEDEIKVISTNPLLVLWFTLKNFARYDLCYDLEEFYNISAAMASLTSFEVVGFSHGIRAGCYNKKVKFNTNQHMVRNFCDLTGTEYPKKLPKLVYKGEDKSFVDDMLNDKPTICLGTDVGMRAKQRLWPTDKWAELADKLITEFGVQVALVKGPKDTIPEKVKAKIKHKDNVKIFEGSLKSLFYLIEKSILCISLDTAPVHISAAMGTPTIGLFGPNTPTKWAPYGKGNVSIYHPLPCSPCIDNKGNVKKCKKNTCMDIISVDEVFKSVKHILENRKV